jgi:hypothetical protein
VDREQVSGEDPDGGKLRAVCTHTVGQIGKQQQMEEKTRVRSFSLGPGT